MVTTHQNVTAEQLLRTPGLGRCELIRGELIMMTPAGFEHGAIVVNFTLPLAAFVKELLNDPEIRGTDLLVRGERRNSSGIGVIEATRGTLFHHYEVDDNDLIRRANLIVSTTNNNEAMNRSVANVAREHLSGQEITEGLLNHVEVAVRAYDPCLSCATHAVGRMPLT